MIEQSGQQRREGLERLYRERFGKEAEDFVVLRADGSNREYYRLVGSPSAIGAYGPDNTGNRAFVGFARKLAEIDLPVPTIYAVDESAGLYLQEDLGSTTLFAHLGTRRSESGKEMPEEIADLYRKIVRLLPRFQIEGGKAVDFSLAFPRSDFDARAISWDLHYFKYLFARLVEVPFNEDRLANDVEAIIAEATAEPPIDFMYRDLQSRNIMLTADRELRFIDFQGGRRGPLQYDLASLLYDAKANLPETFRSELLDLYCTEVAQYREIDTTAFRARFPTFVLLRALQAMGAYGYRGIYQRKAGFVAGIPYAVANVRRLLSGPLSLDLPEISRIFDALAERYPIAAKEIPIASINEPALTLEITSFSYKQGGYPVDASGHGGGHVFDCRWLENPGRYTEYRDLTGRDAGVIDFLESRGEVDPFFDDVLRIVRASLDRYRDRRFDFLSVGFGCTGGQHRSVYMAERLASTLRAADLPEVLIRLRHRELGTR